jgi:hypothetical protein
LVVRGQRGTFSGEGVGGGWLVGGAGQRLVGQAGWPAQVEAEAGAQPVQGREAGWAGRAAQLLDTLIRGLVVSVSSCIFVFLRLQKYSAMSASL